MNRNTQEAHAPRLAQRINDRRGIHPERNQEGKQYLQIPILGSQRGENGAEILYMIIKSPVLLISDRDFVQQRKMWKNFPTNNSHILHFISVENHDCPPNKKCVRAETIISGYYMQDDPNEPGHSVLGVLSQTDIKGNIPHVLVNKFAPKSSRNWIKSLLKGLSVLIKTISPTEISVSIISGLPY